MKNLRDFKEDMKTEEMQTAFRKFAEGKNTNCAEKVEELIRAFALENGYDLADNFAKAEDQLSDDQLDAVSSGQDILDPRKACIIH